MILAEGEDMILLTGATGRVGSAAAAALCEAGQSFRVLVRDADRFLLSAPFIEVIEGDLSDVAKVKTALSGIDRALLVMGNHPEQAQFERRFATQAAEAGVSHLVKISSMEASAETVAVLPQNHFATEQHIVDLGLGWTFLRPNYYMQNMLMYANSIRQAGTFSLPLGLATTAMIDAQDVGEVAAAALTQEGHEGKTHLLTGPDLIDFHGVSRRMSSVLKREISYVEQTPEAFHAVLENVIPSKWQLDAVCELFAEIAKGSLSSSTDTVARILGRPAASIEDFTRRYLPAFGADLP
jgi:uncharacterized protein YbjT (DUF2867 family)